MRPRADLGAVADGLLPSATIAAAGDAVGADLVRANGAPADPDDETAFIELRRHAEAGDALSQSTMALVCQFGGGRPADPPEACRWQQRAARSGVPAAAHFGDRWFEQAALRDDPEACYHLGRMHRDDIGRPPSPAAARTWFERPRAAATRPPSCPPASSACAPHGSGRSAGSTPATSPRRTCGSPPRIGRPGPADDLAHARTLPAEVTEVMPPTGRRSSTPSSNGTWPISPADRRTGLPRHAV